MRCNKFCAFLLILIVLAFTSCMAQITSCKDLAKLEIPNNRIFVDNSPYIKHFSIVNDACASMIFSRPVYGSLDYRGSIINVQKSSVTIYDYNLDESKTTLTSAICSSGSTQIWYFADAKFNKYGAFFCMYTCSGDSLVEYQCATNNKTEFWDDENASVAKALKVPVTTADATIHELPIDCFNQRCKAFY